jgi:hypothetical protein
MCANRKKQHTVNFSFAKGLICKGFFSKPLKKHKKATVNSRLLYQLSYSGSARHRIATLSVRVNPLADVFFAFFLASPPTVHLTRSKQKE